MNYSDTAASFDVVSFQALPTDEMNESEMERELREGEEYVLIDRPKDSTVSP